MRGIVDYPSYIFHAASCCFLAVQVEVYAAAQQDFHLTMHALSYADSQEQQTFQGSLEREVRRGAIAGAKSRSSGAQCQGTELRPMRASEGWDALEWDCGSRNI